MRTAMIAPGSRGDVQPYVALGVGLQEAGHVVRLVTHQDFEELVNSHGLAFWPVEGNVQDIAQGTDMRRLLEKGNFLAIMSQMAKEAERGALHLATAGLAACQGMDLVLAGIGGLFIGLALAEKLQLPLSWWIQSPFPGFFRAARPPYITVALERQPPLSGQVFLLW
jgi:sterol 3beta-glucosyltransferase